MKSDLRRSAASSASLRSRRALLDAEAVGHIGEGHEHRAIRQRRQRQRQDGAVVALDLAQVALRCAPETMAWIRLSHACDAAELFGAGGRDRADMRLAGEILRRQLPDVARTRRCRA